MPQDSGNREPDEMTKAITFDSGGVIIRVEYKIGYARQHIWEAIEARDKSKKTRSVSKTSAPAVFLSEALVSFEDGGKQIPVTLESLQMQSLYLLGTVVNLIKKDLGL